MRLSCRACRLSPRPGCTVVRCPWPVWGAVLLSPGVPVLLLGGASVIPAVPVPRLPGLTRRARPAWPAGSPGVRCVRFAWLPVQRLCWRCPVCGTPGRRYCRTRCSCLSPGAACPAGSPAVPLSRCCVVPWPAGARFVGSPVRRVPWPPVALCFCAAVARCPCDPWCPVLPGSCSAWGACVACCAVMRFPATRRLAVPQFCLVARTVLVTGSGLRGVAGAGRQGRGCCRGVEQGRRRQDNDCAGVGWCDFCCGRSGAACGSRSADGFDDGRWCTGSAWCPDGL